MLISHNIDRLGERSICEKKLGSFIWPSVWPSCHLSRRKFYNCKANLYLNQTASKKDNSSAPSNAQTDIYIILLTLRSLQCCSTLLSLPCETITTCQTYCTVEYQIIPSAMNQKIHRVSHVLRPSVCVMRETGGGGNVRGC